MRMSRYKNTEKSSSSNNNNNNTQSLNCNWLLLQNGGNFFFFLLMFVNLSISIFICFLWPKKKNLNKNQLSCQQNNLKEVLVSYYEFKVRLRSLSILYSIINQQILLYPKVYIFKSKALTLYNFGVKRYKI